MKFLTVACLSLAVLASSLRAETTQQPAAHHHKKKHHHASAHHQKSHTTPQSKSSDRDMNVPAQPADAATHI